MLYNTSFGSIGTVTPLEVVTAYAGQPATLAVSGVASTSVGSHTSQYIDVNCEAKTGTGVKVENVSLIATSVEGPHFLQLKNSFKRALGRRSRFVLGRPPGRAFGQSQS
jgi:hypothetical protein